MTPEESNSRLQKLQSESVGVTKLSILICTTKDRRVMFNTLMQEFYRQISMSGLKGKGIERWSYEIPRLDEQENPVLFEGSPVIDEIQVDFKHPDIVELLFEEDEKQMSVGAKRQKLLERAKGKYIVYFDSDDFPKTYYVEEIVKAIESKPDCVGFKIAMTTNGKNPETCIHSLSNNKWEKKNGIYLRNCTHFNPVKREFALRVGFSDVRWNEDEPYSNAISSLLNSEVFIDKFMFDYRYSNKIEFNEKYGIK